jgi:hypothetical protein
MRHKYVKRKMIVKLLTDRGQVVTKHFRERFWALLSVKFE